MAAIFNSSKAFCEAKASIATGMKTMCFFGVSSNGPEYHAARFKLL